ncbi:hypothetical protein D1007_30893 [Hordeum vulgare]|nr:hypothetical protein D1007_30893 [Hordeum vulgare]
MLREPSTLAQLMAVVDQYAVAESSMKLPMLVDASGKPTAPKPAVAPMAVQYFIDVCRDGTLLKHKLMRREPSTLAQVMAVVDQYAVTESSMKLPVLVDAVGKPTAPKPAAAPAVGRS